MASRSIEDLHPLLKPKAHDLVRMCRIQGVDVLIYCTWRSGIEQDYLYTLGRTVKNPVGVKPWKPMGNIVTNARAGQSAHNFTIDRKPASKAFDCCPMVNGKPVWDEKHPHWQVIGRVAKELGLKWYGEPGSRFKEYPHVEMP